jgi:pilus assembly protein CpaB
VLLVLAVFFGGVAAYVAAGWLKTSSRQAQHTAQQTVLTTPVVVAAKDIAPGSSLEASLLKVVQWPQDAKVEGAMLDPEQLRGRVTRTSLAPGEVILESKLAPKGAPGGLAGIIQPDRRAVTVKVDEASGVAGFVLPGNRVDVLVTISRSEFKDDPVTQVVLQNLPVLGIGQDIESHRGGEKPKVVPTVTLEVTPEESEKLALAAKEGNITLALRGWTEQTAAPTSGVKMSALFQGGKSEAQFAAPIDSVPPPPAKKSGVEVLRGTARETVNF